MERQPLGHLDESKDKEVSVGKEVSHVRKQGKECNGLNGIKSRSCNYVFMSR